MGVTIAIVIGVGVLILGSLIAWQVMARRKFAAMPRELQNQ